jgi:hypothetical protein
MENAVDLAGLAQILSVSIDTVRFHEVSQNFSRFLSA